MIGWKALSSVNAGCCWCALSGGSCWRGMANGCLCHSLPDTWSEMRRWWSYGLMTFMERDFVADIEEEAYGRYMYSTGLLLQYISTVLRQEKRRGFDIQGQKD
ncbi:hypothetical protein OIU85_020480 [Salix viminalis]|uniref:Uncharacterized protein n=1 Tax=Salix viminalis TaxID=40686 RepID=A0A9Q0UGJ3_SALVM|nr:hypothetical protein OIU85_020480 [Salix viminalis]